MAKFLLNIITPHKVVLEEEADMIITRTTEGDLGILAKHTPLVTELSVGAMKIKQGEEEKEYFISGGFLEVLPDKVTVLADDAIFAKDIDIEKAKKEKELNEAKLNKLSEDRDLAMVQKNIQEAITKIRIGENIKI